MAVYGYDATSPQVPPAAPLVAGYIDGTRQDDPPEYEPDDDGEAERIAEQFDEARAELDRGELA